MKSLSLLLPWFLAGFLAAPGAGQATKPPLAEFIAKAEARLKAKDLPGARKALEAGLGAYPDAPRLHLLAARTVYLRAQEISKDPRLVQTVRDEMSLVEEEARVALQGLPASREGRMLLAQALYYQGRFDEADTELATLLAADPNDKGALFLQAEILFLVRAATAAREGKGKEAEAFRARAVKIYEKALAGGADRGRCHHRLGDLATHAGDLDKALDHYGKALAADATAAPHGWLLAITRRPARVKPDRMVALYLKAARARKGARDKGGAARLHMMAGLFLEVAGDWEGARKEALQALALDPAGMWHTEYRAGWCSYWMNEPKEAARTFLHLVRTRRVKFCDHLRAIDRAESKTATAMMHALSSQAVKENRTDDARDLSLLLAIVRGTGEDWNNYAFLCRETGRYKEAWKGYARAIEKDPTNPVYLNDGALILHYNLRTDLEQAGRLYRQAIEEAKKILKDPEAKPDRKAQARLALRDATNNLRRLGRGPGSQNRR